MDEFVTLPERKSEFRQVNFTRLAPGTPVRLRLLDKKAYGVTKHYLPLQRVSIVCLGEACPICANNRRLMQDNQGVAPKDIKGFISQQNRFMVNVYNRSDVKISPSGKVYYPVNDIFPPQDPETGEILQNLPVVSLNRVEVLERGVKLFSQINDTHKTVKDLVTKEPLGVWTYDIVITAQGKGREMTTNVIPYPQMNDKIEVTSDQLYVLSAIPLELTADEITSLLRGVQLRDIFSARKGTNNETMPEKKTDINLAGLDADLSKQANDSLDDLFSD